MNELKPEDVMRALEWCINGEGCQGCSCRKHGDDCIDDLMKGALALLREKDAEIERLQGAVEQYEEERKYHFEMSRKRIADAITEFAEEAKKRLPIISPSVFDNIAKKLKGANNGESNS